MVIYHVAVFFLGLFMLLKGADYFVSSASKIAKEFGVSDFVIGLTLVAFGTTVPELASAMTASFRNASGIIVGNTVGSYIANIGLVIGISATLSDIRTNREVLRRDGYIMLFSSILFFILILNLEISWIEGVSLLFLYISYIGFLFFYKPRYIGDYDFGDFMMFFLKLEMLSKSLEKLSSVLKGGKFEDSKLYDGGIRKFGRDAAFLIVGLTAVILGARFFILLSREDTFQIFDLVGDESVWLVLQTLSS